MPIFSGKDLSTLGTIAAWFALNIAIGNVTKWTYLYGEVCVHGSGCRTFNFPLMLTVVHMLASWGMCRMYIYSVRQSPKGEMLNFRQQIQKVLPLSACFALSVGLGNLSLKYIYPSFNQMLGASTPLITVIMSVILLGKQYNMSTWVAMPIISGGLLICSAKEVNFHVLGALCALGATIFRALKSILQGQLLQGAEKLDSVTLLYYMAPWSAMLLFGMSLCLETLEPLEILQTGLFSPQATGGVSVLVLLVLGGLTACLLNIATFLVTSCTSALTLQVQGNVKNCLNIIVSVAIFHNPFKPLQALGVAICLFGVWLYSSYGGVVQKKTA